MTLSTTQKHLFVKMNSGPGRAARAALGADSNSNDTSGLVNIQQSLSSQRDRRAGTSRIFGKECTVIIDVKDVKKIKASSIIRSVEELTGDLSVYAVVPKGANLYEVTLPNKEVACNILGGIDIDNVHYDCTLLYSDTIIVSIIHLPAYISDEEIGMKLREYGVELLAPIQRRYYPGTQVADGTRYVKCKFPQQVKSLPYSMRFQTVNGQEYFRVLHDNQVKVCSRCLDPGHVMKDCPDFVCYKCGEQGHVAKNCTRQRCDDCGNFPLMCSCKICDKCHNDAQICTCYREDIADIHPQVADGEKEEILELHSAENDEEEVENEILDNDSRERGVENERSKVDKTNEEVESEEEISNNLTISDRSVVDSSDDRMVVEGADIESNDDKRCQENGNDIDNSKVVKRRRRRFNPVPSLKNSMRRQPII